jgi:hypothetical protein
VRRAIIILLFSAGLTLAAVGVTSLWEESGWNGLVGRNHWLVAEIEQGHLGLGLAQRTEASPSRSRLRLPLGWFGRISFSMGVNRAKWRYATVRLPVWIPVLLLFIHPAIAFVRGPVLRHRRWRRNQCLECGYDVTGSPSGICSECGEVFRCQLCGLDLRGSRGESCPACGDQLDAAPAN